jgi:hypothetical protein
MLSAILFMALSAESFIEFELEIEAIRADECLNTPFFNQLYSDYQTALHSYVERGTQCEKEHKKAIPENMTIRDAAIGIINLRKKASCERPAFAERLYSVAALQAYFRKHLPKTCAPKTLEKANHLANTKFNLEPTLFLSPNPDVEILIGKINKERD